jgi:peptide/nickel transport system permease protein
VDFPPRSADRAPIDNQDRPEILGVTMLTAFFIIIANLVVDILYAVVDPRVRH